MAEFQPRTEQDVKDLLMAANLNYTEFDSLIQVLDRPLPESSSCEKFILFEMPKSLIMEIMKNEEGKFEIKSESENNSPAFLHTTNYSYKLTEVEISNKLLILPDLWIPGKESQALKPKQDLVHVKVSTQLKSKLDLTLVCEPKLNKLMNKLTPSMLRNHIDDNVEDLDLPDLLTKEQLFSIFPSSRKEFSCALRALKAIEYNGFVRMLDIEYIHKIVSTIFDVCDELSLNIDEAIQMNLVIEGIKCLFPPSIVFQVLSFYFYASLHEEEVLLYPNKDAICTLYGEHILSVLASKFALKDFLTIWQDSVPQGMIVHLQKHLTGCGRAICRSVYMSDSIEKEFSEDSPRCIELLRSEDLVDDEVENRLYDLFDKKKYWSEFELAGYMLDIIPVDKKHSHEIQVSYPNINASCTFHEYIFTEQNPLECPKVPPAITTALNKFCRSTSHPRYERIYLLKHPQF